MTARSVCGCHPPNLAPTPREAATVSQGLADPAEHLEILAHRIFTAGDDTSEPETFALDALAADIACASCELRMRQHGKDGAPCHD